MKIIEPFVVAAIITFIVMLAGCAKPVMIPAELMAQENLCFHEVAKVQISTNAANYRQTRVQFKDERNAVLVIAIEALAKSNAQVALSPFIPCTLTVQAFLRENGAINRSNNELAQKAIGATAIVGGIWVGGMALENVLGSITAGGATTINNSRVTSGNVGDGTFSSSGTGLGVGNTQGGGDTVGGLYPRSQMDTVATDNGTNSNSGEAVINMPPLEDNVPAE